MWIGVLIGLAVGYAVCHYFIFPADVFNIKLANLTVGEVFKDIGRNSCYFCSGHYWWKYRLII